MVGRENTSRWSARKKKFIAGLTLIVMLSIGLGVGWHKVLYHFKTVDAGKLYRSGTLSLLGLELAHSVYGIKTIVNLRSQAELKRARWYEVEKDFAEKRGVHLVNIPMLPDTPPRPEQIDKFLAVVTDSRMLPVLVHCEAGIIRTGMMVAVYKIAVLDQPNEKVLAELPMFGRTFRRRPAVRDFILNYGG